MSSISSVFKRWITLKIHARFDRSLYNSNRDRAQLSELVHEMQWWEKRLEDEDYGSILDLCGQLRAITEGKDVHRHIVNSRLEREQFLGTKLTQMYGACGYPIQAEECFERIIRKDIGAWTSVIDACSKNDDYTAARSLFKQMVLQPVHPDEAAYVAVLRACVGAKFLSDGAAYHSAIRRSGMESSPEICRALLDMYNRCESLENAVELFGRVKNRVPDAGIWVTMVAVYAQFGHSSEASAVFKGMLQEGLLQVQTSCEMNILGLLRSYTRPRELELGKIVHACAKMAELDKTDHMRVEILGMYARCGSLEDARAIFDEADEARGADVHMFRALMEACMWQYAHKDAIQLLREMDTRKVTPDRCIFLAAIRACSSFQDCRLVHSLLKANEVTIDAIYKSYLMRNYVRCTEVSSPEKFFEEVESESGAPRKEDAEWIELSTGEFVKLSKKSSEKHRKVMRRKSRGV